MTENLDVVHEHAEVNGVRLHYGRAGEGPLMLFLHGFPQSWYMWRHQLPEFARDHLVVALDQRGYNLSAKPEGVQNYGVRPAVEDARALAEHLGYDSFVLVGHDWGSAVGWSLALHYPELLDALVILCGPHPGAFDRALDDDREQQRASQYLLAVRRPDAAQAIEAGDFAALEATLDFPFFTDADRSEYRRSWRIPGALEGMMHWYRAEGLGPAAPDLTPARGNYVHDVCPLAVEVPTLVIYPDADQYVRPAAHRTLDDYVANLRFEAVPGASHWVAEERPEMVNRWIGEFLEGKVSVPA